MKSNGFFAWIPLALALSAALVGCSSDECVAGKDCVCDGDSCDFACAGENQAGCNLNCTAGQACAMSCPGGSCNMTCTGSTSCELDCPDGSCNLSCTGTQSCKITACSGSCNLSCGGAATCSSACDTAQSCVTSQ